MPKVCGVRFHPLDRISNSDPKNLNLKINDLVVVQTNQGVDAGKVCYLKEIPEREITTPLFPILRKVTLVDLEKIKKYQTRAKKVIIDCQALVKKHQLPLKLSDAHFSLDGSRVIFYFTAETRIDFRALVKELTRKFQKSIRLQQIGSRDAVKELGSYGLCGRELCCKRFLKEMKSIPTDLAEIQQMTQRGSERISGVCGRLICCLAFEAPLYQNLSKGMPQINDEVITPKGKGKVIFRNILKQKVEVQFKDQTKSEFPLTEIKCQK